MILLTDILWILLIALLISSAFSYGGRRGYYRYGYNQWANFWLVFLGAILLSYVFVWLVGLAGIVATGPFWGILGTVIGSLIVFGVLYALAASASEQDMT